MALIDIELNQRFHSSLATQFKALGDPTRLRIFEFLRGCSVPVEVDDNGDVRPGSGPTVGEICCHISGVDRVTSAISFHLKELKNAGLIQCERRGKNLFYAVDAAAIEKLNSYFGQSTARALPADCCAQ